ncbi:MAG: 30S ribosomal protein S17 [Candidatus Magasanikbacteria bacterium GW2011_GWA2_45_39]|uniref:30S ribosomal protein S17 n=2 Tax=Candidatus Magasanikiibacteriota TaxID=1752731 RepID=A0A0G1QX71_9BACT|nr:MAG: 30S ribosomal protein S17 [Candidatus Magasanikbacteria bacterium GW2011_GWA2_45_39]KKU13255.1 MAG: 30S ribosomal protein S17 [Candidatus Magasanikbacteria bacterium GW2011_GWC2_45_8]HBW73675.1 30S ribosomal protein S17 [Candidatus Magasanikbacteria bacterium]
MQERKNVQHKVFTGIVTSAKMPKTLVVKVEKVKKHPKYLKFYTVHSKFKVHYTSGTYAHGDKVSFIECRPLSKDKRWRIFKKH